jgi:hypothetical protein
VTSGFAEADHPSLMQPSVTMNRVQPFPALMYLSPSQNHRARASDADRCPGSPRQPRNSTSHKTTLSFTLRWSDGFDLPVRLAKFE